MRHLALLTGFALAVLPSSGPVNAESIRGTVVDLAGKPIEGVMVSAIDDEHRKWTSVFTQKNGSFAIFGLRNVDHNIRTRLMGLADQWSSGVAAGTHDIVVQARPAVGDELELQRPANSAFSMLAFDNSRDMIALDPDSGRQTTIKFPSRVYAPHSAARRKTVTANLAGGQFCPTMPCVVGGR